MNTNNYLQAGKSINVTASAGTGKTWVIISKILRLLLEGEDPEKITAITFTKKASAEMRERLNEKIESWATQDEDKLKFELREIGINKNYSNYANRAKNLFYEIQIKNKDIRISTFDSFFVEILSQFHLDKDIEKNYETNTDVNSKKIINDVEKKIFCKDYIKENIKFERNINFLLQYTNSFNSLKESIREIINKKSYYLEIIESNKLETIDIEKIEKKIYCYQNKLISEVSAMCNEIEIEKFKDLSDIVFKNISNEQKINFIVNFFFTKDRKIRKNIEKLCLKNNYDVKKIINAIYLYESELFNDIQILWKNVVGHFFTEYQRVLKEKRLYDFSDKTWLCYKKLSSLSDDDWIFYKISNSIKHILIDEFQDTNYIQWKVIEMILVAISNNSDESSVTIVGDEKQSIYGFRGSEPLLFKICKDFTNNYFNSTNIVLNESKRSSEEIIDFINNTFINNEKFSTTIKAQGMVKLNEIKKNTNGNEAEDLLIDEMIKIESEIISEQIVQLCKEKNIQYEDILILVRNRSHMSYIKDSLINKDIPVILDNKICLMAQPEINDIKNLLKLIIIDDNDKGLLYKLLISPIFNISIGKLEKLNIKNYADMKKFLIKTETGKFLSEWKSLVGKIPIHDLLDKIYKDIDIFTKYRSENKLENIEVKNNILNFLNLSLKINNGRYISPLFFLNQIEIMENYEETYEVNSLNSVRVLTIHAAKGLESKVVFLAQTYKKNKLMQNKVYPVFNSDLSCKDILYKFDVFKNNIFIEELFQDASYKEIAEETNLSYVACTRAKNILVINGFNTKKDNWFSSYLADE